ncbi:MAG: aldo/keto reductase [Clostridia bacterium]|nr:aldo/keto reductase [Clostridia bacterium]
MLYFDFKGKKISKLGFGLMRLPLLSSGEIDRDKTAEMIDEAMNSGINYFDTAAPYHSGMSEIVAGELLGKYPREKYYLADKYPGHQVAKTYNPKETFEKQLNKCKTDYFDFYLLHNVSEQSFPVYSNPDYGIVEYFVKQKQEGRIKHLGFSSHGMLPNLAEALSLFGSEMEFCQIQLNYLDWTQQSAFKKVEMLKAFGIPVWVMEPLRGGKLANPGENIVSTLKKARPNASPQEWAFDFLLDTDNVGVILSGMSSLEQLKDNIGIFSNYKSFSKENREYLLKTAELLKRGVPCTGCHYCVEYCPMGLDIPKLLNLYNDAMIQPSVIVDMQLSAIQEGKKPSDCLKCRSCEKMCPQGIKISEALEKFVEIIPDIPSWEELCKKRALEEKKFSKKLN